MHTTIRRGLFPALSLGLLLAAQTAPAAAAEFTPLQPKALTTSGKADAWQRGLAVTGGGVLVAGFEEFSGGAWRTFVRRSIDAGDTWSVRRRISGSAPQAVRLSLAAGGDFVDAVWVEGRNCAGNCRLRYRRSGDGGASFGSPITLDSGNRPGLAQVARNGDIVAVAWTDWKTGYVKARVSTDGGASFGSPVTLGRTSNEPVGGDRRDGWATVAIGADGAIHVAFFRRPDTLRLRRSLDSGDTWLGAQTMHGGANGFGGASLTAEGDRLVLGFSRFNGTRTWPVTRSSEDRGASWGPTVAVPTADGSRVRWGGYLVVSFAGPDHVLALFTSCVTDTCRKTRLHGLRTEDLGHTWPDRFVAGGSAARFLYPSGIEGDGRVALTFVRVTASGVNLVAQAVQVDEPAPAGTRRSRR